MKIKILFIIILFFTTACTIIEVKPKDAIIRDNLSTLTLIDDQRIRTNGFVLENDKVSIRENGIDLTIPASEIHEIVTVERPTFASKAAAGGATAGAVWAVYDITIGMTVDAAWGILLYPLAVVALGLYAGAAGYVIGNRTYYEFNPIDLNQQTKYSSSLYFQEKIEEDGGSFKWGGYHFGLNFGGGMALFPSIEGYSTMLAQDSKVFPFFAGAELGKWVDPKTIWGGSIAVVSVSDGNERNMANRDIFSIGPQITYFPKRYGLNFKGAVTYSIYSEYIEDLSVVDSTGIGKTIYGKDFDGVGVSGSIGYAFPLSTHINISAELMGQGYYFSGNDPIATASILVGAHWY